MTPEARFDLARALVTAIQHVRHYGADHRTTTASLEDLFITIRRHMAAGPVRIDLGTLSPENQHAAALAVHLTARSVQALTMRADTTLKDVEALVRLLALEPEELIAEGGLSDALRQSRVPSIQVRETQAARASANADGSNPVHMAQITLDYLMTEASRSRPVDMARARQAIEPLVQDFAKNPKPLWQAIAARTHDELDALHGVSTAVMTIAVAEALEASDQARVDLGAAALLHDIGLAGLPTAVRVRERTAEGAQDSWRHPAEGGFILRDAENGGTLAMIVAMEHHLPALQRAGALSQSRLIGLADYVDAMTSARAPGLRRATVDSVMGHLLAGEGPLFDPVHVRLLAAVLHDAAAAGVDFWSA